MNNFMRQYLITREQEHSLRWPAKLHEVRLNSPGDIPDDWMSSEQKSECNLQGCVQSTIA